jgi:ethanolamine ammonia-lyase small subunit
MDETNPARSIDRGLSATDEPIAIRSALKALREKTPARILAGRAGASYQTNTWLELRRDHAVARDAVLTELHLIDDLGSLFAKAWQLFEVNTLARTKSEFLLRPELGRSLDQAAKHTIAELCPPTVDLQLAIADGLSAAAVRTQVPVLLPMIASEADHRGWRFGRPFFIRHGRVGVLNDVGEVLNPLVVVLLVGERPGLATAESLSAYMGYRPRSSHDNSNRNLISNIHSRGVSPSLAAHRIAEFAAQMMRQTTSGVAIKERWEAAHKLASSSTPGIAF